MDAVAGVAFACAFTCNLHACFQKACVLRVSGPWGATLHVFLRVPGPWGAKLHVFYVSRGPGVPNCVYFTCPGALESIFCRYLRDLRHLGLHLEVLGKQILSLFA